MTRWIALLRGINVGGARRIAMAELRELLGDLGYANVATLLNSGNLVFDASGPTSDALGRSLERSLARTFGFAVPVVVLSSARLDQIIRDNPLPELVTQASRFLVALACAPGGLAAAGKLSARGWAPERIALRDEVAYLWCCNGIADSALMKAFSGATGAGATARNWQTLLRLQALAHAPAARPRRSRT